MMRGLVLNSFFADLLGSCTPPSLVPKRQDDTDFFVSLKV